MTSRHPAVSCACPKCQSERRTTPPPTPASEEREAVALEDCPIGLFISRYGSLCLKTEYGDNNGRIDAYIVSSGEMFWGDPPQTVASQRASMVTPVDYAAEILAAEARGMGRARTVVQNTRDGMKFDPSATLEWRNAITGGFNAADLALRHELDAIERNETEAEATAAWNRRTTPPPASEEREAVARAMLEWGTPWDSVETESLADAALSALAPIRAQEIAAARAEEQGYRHTQVAALKQVHAAEILAAEANERARWVDWLATGANVWRETTDNATGEPPKFFHAQGAEYAMIKVMDAMRRNEHGAGK